MPNKKGSGTLSTKKKAVISILTAAAVLLAVFAGNELYKTGYEAGLYEGHSGWYDKGYEEGSQDGYERGFEEGAAYVKASLSTEKKPEKANEHEETLFAEENMPETQPDANEHGFDFVLNKNSKRFHKPECTSVSTMKEENREYYSGSREELIAKGYKPCGSCNP